MIKNAGQPPARSSDGDRGGFLHARSSETVGGLDFVPGRGANRVGIAAVMLTVVLLTQEVPASRTWTYWTLPLSGKVIAIDAGHGGVDGGAVSKQGLVEKDLNLAIALQLRDFLQQAGAIVVMTREGDYDLAEEGTSKISKRKTQDLLNRAKFVKEKHASLLLSIHMNSIPSPKWSGAQTFFYPNQPENAILASLIQDEIRRNLGNTERLAEHGQYDLFAESDGRGAERACGSRIFV